MIKLVKFETSPKIYIRKSIQTFVEISYECIKCVFGLNFFLVMLYQSTPL